MTHASLFSGIGGFDLAAERAGWTNLFHCEIDPFCRRVLKYHFPDTIQYEDIRTTDFTLWRDRIDVLTGGFPCQPFSVAGKRQGTADDRYLWPEMLRAVRAVRPRWVVGENVYGIVNWSGGMVFDQVCADLEDAGFAVLAFVLPACAVGAPHRRDRTWFVAHRADAGPQAVHGRENGIHADRPAADASRIGCKQRRSAGTGNVQNEKIGTDIHVASERFGREWSAADTGCGRPSEWDAKPLRIGSHPAAQRHDRIPCWQDFPTQSPVCRRDDGLPCGLDGITFPKWRKESIRGYGNAIVPQVASVIFETINEYEAKTKQGRQ